MRLLRRRINHEHFLAAGFSGERDLYRRLQYFFDYYGCDNRMPFLVSLVGIIGSALHRMYRLCMLPKSGRSGSGLKV
jgi:hypothetical protein